MGLVGGEDLIEEEFTTIIAVADAAVVGTTASS